MKTISILLALSPAAIIWWSLAAIVVLALVTYGSFVLFGLWLDEYWMKGRDRILRQEDLEKWGDSIDMRL